MHLGDTVLEFLCSHMFLWAHVFCCRLVRLHLALMDLLVHDATCPANGPSLEVRALKLEQVPLACKSGSTDTCSCLVLEPNSNRGLFRHCTKVCNKKRKNRGRYSHLGQSPYLNASLRLYTASACTRLDQRSFKHCAPEHIKKRLTKKEVRFAS